MNIYRKTPRTSFKRSVVGAVVCCLTEVISRYHGGGGSSLFCTTRTTYGVRVRLKDNEKQLYEAPTINLKHFKPQLPQGVDWYSTYEAFLVAPLARTSH